MSPVLSLLAEYDENGREDMPRMWCKMIISTSELIELKKKHPQASAFVKELFIKKLSPTQRKIYKLLGDCACLSSRDLSLKHGMIQTTAAQALREMREIGIVDRKSVQNSGSPNMFVYWRTL